MRVNQFILDRLPEMSEDAVKVYLFMVYKRGFDYISKFKISRCRQITGVENVREAIAELKRLELIQEENKC